MADNQVPSDQDTNSISRRRFIAYGLALTGGLVISGITGRIVADNVEGHHTRSPLALPKKPVTNGYGHLPYGRGVDGHESLPAIAN